MIWLIYALAVLIVWGYFDHKEGEIYTVLMILPCVALPFIAVELLLWFGVMFLCCLFMHVVMKEIGFADVIAVPFTLFFVLAAGFPMLAVFPMALWLFLIKATRKKGLIGTCYLRFLPILMWSFIISFGVHIVWGLLL